MLGKTGLEVSVIGMGCWAIGGDAWGPVDDRDSKAAMERALELGVNFFDTADVYGRGHSEELLGQAIGSRRDDVVISTKVGLWDSHVDVKPNLYRDPKLIHNCCNESLRRLRTDHIDVYLCHLWWDENTEVFLEAFEDLKRQGKVRAYGVSTDDVNHLRHFNRDGRCEVLQLDYSIFNRKPENDVLPYCAESNIGTIVRGPLRMGLLTGKFSEDTTFPDGDVRRDWPWEEWWPEGLDRTERLKRLAGENRNLAQVALRFVLEHPAVHTAIPGAKTPRQMESNAAAAEVSFDPQELKLIDDVTPTGASLT